MMMRMVMLLLLLLVATALVPGVERVRDHNRGNPATLRLDLSMPVTSVLLTRGSDTDYQVTADIVYQFRQHISDATRLRLVWGAGLTNTYAEGSTRAGSHDVLYWGLSARYYMGFSYEISDRTRVQLVPYIGGGVGYMDVDAPGLRKTSDDNYLLDYGAQLHVGWNLDHIDLAAGLSWTARRGSHFMEREGGGYQKWTLHQDHPALHLSLGWRF